MNLLGALIGVFISFALLIYSLYLFIGKWLISGVSVFFISFLALVAFILIIIYKSEAIDQKSQP